MIETVGDVKTFLTRVRYRPGWQISASVDPHFGVRLGLMAWVHDSFYDGEFEFEAGPQPEALPFDITLAREAGIYTMSRPQIRCSIPAVQIISTHALHLPLSADDLLRSIREWLGEVELHERDEWLRVDNEMPFNPHA